MKIEFQPIPKDKQLEAICKLFLSETREVLQPYVNIKKWPEAYEWDNTKYKKFFDFKREELVKYLKENPKLCELHYRTSLGKRTTGAFMIEKLGKFKTGNVSNNDEIQYCNEFNNIYEATADYILIDFGIENYECELSIHENNGD